MVKRSLSNSPIKNKRQKSSNPLAIKPLGNLLFHPEQEKTRLNGLGSLSALPDEILLSNLFVLFTGEEMCEIASISRAFYAWSEIEGLWKGIYITKSKGKLLTWYGSWKKSYIATFLPVTISTLTNPPVTTPTLHSDVLFQPHLCAAFEPESILKIFKESIQRIDGSQLAPNELPLIPTILTGCMKEWPAMQEGKRRWELETLAKRFSEKVLFRAEATLTSFTDYLGYHGGCETDESPLYLFESDFVEKTKGLEGVQTEEKEGEGVELGMGEDYSVPACFSEDLFKVMGAARPDYRWLIVGPKRSGSTWHQDPNGTSAWNAVTIGAKAWICFSPDIIPPGVFVSEDRSNVEAPLSLAEWFVSYYNTAKKLYGTKSKAGSKMLEGICRAGEIFFIPSGWWHIVINLEDSIAVTQNFVSNRELPSVLEFMRERPEQVSGFKPANTEEDCDALIPNLYASFCSGLIAHEPKLEELINQNEIHKESRKVEREIGLWEGVKGDDSLFSFGFGEEDDSLDSIEL